MYHHQFIVRLSSMLTQHGVGQTGRSAGTSSRSNDSCLGLDIGVRMSCTDPGTLEIGGGCVIWLNGFEDLKERRR